jgi:hypothetical protein
MDEGQTHLPSAVPEESTMGAERSFSRANVCHIVGRKSVVREEARADDYEE